MKRFITILMLASGLAWTSTHAGNLEVRGYFWLLSPEGDASVGSGDQSGTRFDVEDDLGYGSDEEVLGVRAHLGDMHQLGVDYFSLDLSANNVVDRTIRFGDEVFRASDNVSSSLEADLVRGYYRLNVGSENAQGGFIVGGQYVSMDVAASADSVGSASESAEAISPVIGLHFFAKPIPQVVLEASVVGADWDFGDIEATFIDFEASASIRFDPGLLAGVAYRHVEIEAKYDAEPVEVDLSLSGPVFFAGFVF